MASLTIANATNDDRPFNNLLRRLSAADFALVEPYLKRMEKPGYDPFHSRIEITDWRKLLILWRQGRYALT